MNTKTSSIPFPFYLTRAREISNGIYYSQQLNVGKVPPLGLSTLKQSPRIAMGDGSHSISIQASETHHCEPRKNLEFWMYDSFECGFPTCTDSIIEPYGDGDGVYSRVPRAVLQAYIDKLGGIVGYVSNYHTGDFSPIPLTHQEATMYALKG
jgi:hypothetical protein